MKHGDKAKGKASKASGKKSIKAGPAAKSSKAGVQAHSKSSPGKASPSKGGNGTLRGRNSSDPFSFSNATVGAAFKRAVKKYPNAFRRLTD